MIKLVHSLVLFAKIHFLGTEGDKTTLGKKTCPRMGSVGSLGELQEVTSTQGHHAQKDQDTYFT